MTETIAALLRRSLASNAKNNIIKDLMILIEDSKDVALMDKCVERMKDFDAELRGIAEETRE